MTARILAYHRVCDDPSPGLETWAVARGAFRRQMALLKRLGYRGVTVRELLDRLDTGWPADKLVAITFDDGYRDTVEVAAPILARFGFTATVYIVTGKVGGHAGWDAGGDPAPLAGWDDLARLVEAGWEVGMHTYSHPARLDLLRGPDLEREVSGGLDDARACLGTRIDSFAFPHGNYSRATLAAVRAAGFRAALTVAPGAVTAAAPRFTLPRYEVKRRDTLPEFALTVTTGIAPRRRATLARLLPSRPTTTDLRAGLRRS